MSPAKKRGRKPLPAADVLGSMLGLRVTAAEQERLRAITARFRGAMKPHELARAAFRIGLEAIEADPTVLLRTDPPHRRSAR
jgi:hypothetical protein